jgi:hypothetical protein
MAAFFLCTPVTIGSTHLRPGKVVNDTDSDFASLVATGVLMWPTADYYVAAAALLVAKAQKKGADDDDLESLMLASCVRSLQNTAPAPAPIPSSATIVPFGPATPSPLVLQAVASGNVLVMARVVILSPFDDPAATCELGTSADPALSFATGESDLSSPGTYSSDACLSFNTADQLRLSIFPGASVSGSALLVYSVGMS